MHIEQLYTNCLSEAAYYIESNGEVAIIDPLRDTDKYVEMATARNAKIKYIFETHFHADFVSGHIDLAQKTGAKIIFGPNAKTNYKVYNAKDNEVFQLGKATITALHTPGHTIESTCYLLKDNHQKQVAIFTGDTLFVGDVGRPDLFSGNLSKEELASMMYDSLNTKIKALDDEVKVYPAHGPGSSCGKNVGPNTFSTVKEQKETNYALQEQTREEFIKAVTGGLSEPPPYFPLNAKINQEGYDSLDAVLASVKAMNIEEFKKALEQDVLLLDTRNANTFTEGFVPGAISIGLEGRFAEWVGTILPITKPIILVTEKGKEQESIIRLSRVGYDNVMGYLEGGFETWRSAGETIDLIINVEADELLMDLKYDDNLKVIDVRKSNEFSNGHIQGAIFLPLNEIGNPVHLAHFEETDNLYVHCAGGYRSVIAASIMKRHGIHNLHNVLGGYAKIKEVEAMPIVLPSTKLN